MPYLQLLIQCSGHGFHFWVRLAFHPCYARLIMRPLMLVSLFAAVVSASVMPAHAQKFIPKSIQFVGAPEYSTDELMAAAGLKKGVALSFDDMNACTKKLLDTGVFSSLEFKFDGQDLIFTLEPNHDLAPVKLANLPLTPGKYLDARLHQQVPLFHGKVPRQGTLAEDVREALEKLLQDGGLKAKVTSAANAYLIAAPPVVVGEIRVGGSSSALEPGAQDILTKLTGSPYDIEGTPIQIVTYLDNYYHDEGYLEAAITANRRGLATEAGDVIHVPFEVTATPGIQYRLAAVQFAPDVLVTQAEFDHQSLIHPGEVAAGQLLTDDWIFVAKQYHNHGFMKPSVHPTPSFDHAKGTVSYMVAVDPGAEYRMGKLTIENVNDDLRAIMLSEWKMPAGAVFDESAILRFFSIGDANQTLKRIFQAVTCKYSLTVNDDSKTVDVVLRLEKRH